MSRCRGYLLAGFRKGFVATGQSNPALKLHQREEGEHDEAPQAAPDGGA